MYSSVWYLWEFDGLLLFLGGSEEGGEEQQAGGRDVLAVRRWGERGLHDNGDTVLLCSILSETLEGHYMHLLWSCS